MPSATALGPLGLKTVYVSLCFSALHCHSPPAEKSPAMWTLHPAHPQTAFPTPIQTPKQTRMALCGRCQPPPLTPCPLQAAIRTNGWNKRRFFIEITLILSAGSFLKAEMAQHFCRVLLSGTFAMRSRNCETNWNEFSCTSSWLASILEEICKGFFMTFHHNERWNVGLG